MKSSSEAPALKRVKVRPSDARGEIQSLAKQAQLVLGYNRLANLCVVPTTLGTVLRQLEIEPFSERSVKEYKNSAVQKLVAERQEERKRNRRHHNSSGQRDRYREIVSWKRKPISEYDGVIPEFALRKAIAIKSACPEAELSVEQLVVRRKRVVAYAPPARNRRDPDPFLVARLRSEEYHFEVWDEREFEGKSL